MRIFLYEIRKILNPILVVFILALYFIYLFVFPSPMLEKNSYFDNGEEYMRGILAQYRQYDMLLERYGSEITKEETDDFYAYCDEYIENLNKAVAENDLCQKYGVTDYTQLSDLSSFLGEQYWEVVDPNADYFSVRYKNADEQTQRYFEDLARGRKPVDTDGKYFVTDIDTLNGITYAIRDGIAEHGDDYVFHVYTYYPMGNVIRDAGGICMVTVICALLLIFPYMVRENRSGSTSLQYTTKAGRKLYRTKFGAATFVSALFTATGCILAYWYIESIGLNRYYDSKMDSMLEMVHGHASHHYWGIKFGVFVWLIPLVCFLFGVALSGIVYLLTTKCSNHITALAAVIPLIGIVYFCEIRYVDIQFDGFMYKLLFRSEPIAVLAVLAAVMLAAFAFSYRKALRSDVQ